MIGIWTALVLLLVVLLGLRSVWHARMASLCNLGMQGRISPAQFEAVERKGNHAFALAAAAWAVLALTAFSACTLSKTDNTNINAPSQVQAPPASPAPGASAAPAAGSGALCPLVARVRVAPFGIDCPSGSAPNNGSGILPRGCTAHVTATGKDSQDTDVQLTDAYPITWQLVSGAGIVSTRADPNETFNQFVQGLAPGAFDVSATVCGQTGHYQGSVQ